MATGRPKIATDEDARRPARMSLDQLGDIVTVSEVAEVCRLDKKTVLKAIHSGTLPAFFPAGSQYLGFRLHRADVEAWYFNDPERAHTRP